MPLNNLFSCIIPAKETKTEESMFDDCTKSSDPVLDDSDSDYDEKEIVKQRSRFTEFRIIPSSEGRMIVSKGSDIDPLGITFEDQGQWFTWSELTEKEQQLLAFEEIELHRNMLTTDLRLILPALQKFASYCKKLRLKGTLKCSILRRIIMATAPATVEFSHHDYAVDYIEFKKISALEIACRSQAAAVDPKNICKEMTNHKSIRLIFDKLNTNLVNTVLQQWSSSANDYHFSGKTLIFSADTPAFPLEKESTATILNGIIHEEQADEHQPIGIRNQDGNRADVSFTSSEIKIKFH